jgi:SHS2 domain-containing protein
MHRWVEHTAELELELEAKCERELLAEALMALAEVLSADEPPAGERALRTVQASAPDRPALLAAFLEELVFLAEAEGFVPCALERLELGADRLEAVVAGVLDAPRPLVKAVTYHRLAFEPADGGYRARVVLDV